MHTPVSLLQRIQKRPDDQGAWRRLVDLYQPFVRGWLLRDPALRQDADDVTADVLQALVEALPRFERRRDGSFRCWLRTVTLNKVKTRHRAASDRPDMLAADGSWLAELEDPAAPLSREWDRAHDQHVLGRLLDLVACDFDPITFRAFLLHGRDGKPAAEVANELGLTVAAVFSAKARVLRRLREEADGLLD
ncbi:MAG: sigma-70 family RNA polymerase sigma factor [Gemmataceae bacterium]